jgi:hypothetical protein
MLLFVLAILTAGVFSVIVIQTRAHRTCVAALLIMRVYALYCRNKWVLSVVLLEVIAAIFLACVSAALEGSDTCIIDWHVNFGSGVSHE